MNKCQKAIFIAGTTKAGTTSLFDYLAQVEGVNPAVRKETRFFLPESFPMPRVYRFEDGLEKYLRFYPNLMPSQCLLDGTPDYMYSASAIDRIFSSYPDALVVIVLRNPVDRLLSWFNFSKQIGSIDNGVSLQQFLDMQVRENAEDSERQHLRALEQGRYGHYLGQYYQRYATNIMLIDFEDLKERPESVILRVLERVGMKSSIIDVNFSVSNESFSVRNQRAFQVYQSVRRYLGTKTAFFPVVHRFGQFLRRLADQLFFFLDRAEKPKKESFSDSQLEDILDFYGDQNGWVFEQLEEF